MMAGARWQLSTHLLRSRGENVPGGREVASNPATIARVLRLRGPADGVSPSDELIPARSLERELEPLAQVDGRLPPQDLPGLGDVRATYLRVVLGQRLVDDLGARAGDRDHLVGELQQRELVRVADVDRLVMTGLGERDDPAHQVVDVTE